MSNRRKLKKSSNGPVPTIKMLGTVGEHSLVILPGGDVDPCGVICWMAVEQDSPQIDVNSLVDSISSLNDLDEFYDDTEGHYLLQSAAVASLIEMPEVLFKRRPNAAQQEAFDAMLSLAQEELSLWALIHTEIGWTNVGDDAEVHAEHTGEDVETLRSREENYSERVAMWAVDEDREFELWDLCDSQLNALLTNLPEGHYTLTVTLDGGEEVMDVWRDGDFVGTGPTEGLFTEALYAASAEDGILRVVNTGNGTEFSYMLDEGAWMENHENPHSADSKIIAGVDIDEPDYEVDQCDLVYCSQCGKQWLTRDDFNQPYAKYACADHGMLPAETFGWNVEPGQQFVTEVGDEDLCGYLIEEVDEVGDGVDAFSFLVERGFGPAEVLVRWSQRQVDADFAIDHALGLAEKVLDAVVDRDPDATRIMQLTCKDGDEFFVGEIHIYPPDEDAEAAYEYSTDAHNYGLSDPPEFPITTLAAGLVAGGSFTVRTLYSEGNITVTGYALDEGDVVRLSEAEIFDAYCTDSDTGEPIPPEMGVTYIGSPKLPIGNHS